MKLLDYFCIDKRSPIDYYRYMSNEMLNVEKVERLIDERGLRKNWVIRQIGLKPTSGHMLLKNGVLPKDPEVKDVALEKLAELLGVDERQILLRLPIKAMKAS